MLSGKFGDASATIVIEQFLGMSCICLTDGNQYVLLRAKDYKRIIEGRNTGGMGAVHLFPLWMKPYIKSTNKSSIYYQGSREEK
jgi:phosphoribosylamine--glycine ligase